MSIRTQRILPKDLELLARLRIHRKGSRLKTYSEEIEELYNKSVRPYKPNPIVKKEYKTLKIIDESPIEQPKIIVRKTDEVKLFILYNRIRELDSTIAQAEYDAGVAKNNNYTDDYETNLEILVECVREKNKIEKKIWRRKNEISKYTR